MPSKLKDLLVRWLITTAAVLVATRIVPGINYDKPVDLIIATLVLGILNAILRPLLTLLALPLVILTLGLFYFIINALLLYFVGNVVSGFHVDSFWAAFWGGLVISFFSLVLSSITGVGNARVSVRRGGPLPPRSDRRDDGGGPVIDV
ncbi:MAG TPA: phage holin family protein [Verrucomicrobiae bacterium]|jgi:putative membrane protein|nr:phage holin family protein [Verrucomicrobiae bacterium]